MSFPGWQTDELVEEWVESGSPPPESPSEKQRSVNKTTSLSSSTLAKGKGSIANKRGSLRTLGYSAPRGLPSRRNTADSPERVVSGHGGGSRLCPSGEFIIPQGTGILSPPSSRSGSEDGPEGDVEAEAEASVVEQVAGTCVVKDGVDDDRGGALARLGVKSKDIFGKNALERMFEPPSPPTAPADSTPIPPTTVESTTPSRPPPASTPSSGASSVDEVRRASHPFAPRNPSRLSKSMTPSSHNSSIAPSETSQIQGDESVLNDTLPPAEDDDELSLAHQPGEFETDMSPLARGATRFPFTFKASVRATSGETGSGTGSGSATIRGGSVRSQLPPDEDDEFEALFNQPDNGEGPSHSTIHHDHPPLRASVPAPRLNSTGLPPQSPHLTPNPNLRLFRSTYDTYTREHLSAIVDSIGIEASPSPPPPNAAEYQSREWSPADSGSPGSGGYDERSGSGRSGEEVDSWGSSHDSSDTRSSKRLRLSPPSPKRQSRDWGNVGLEILGRIKGRQVEESITSASPHQSGGSLLGVEGSNFEYPVIPPTPQLDRSITPPLRASRLAPSSNFPNERSQESDKPGPNGNHRSNPSTASSGYLRTAEAMMANLRQRAVSDSASAISGGAQTADSSAGDRQYDRSRSARQVLSETDENAGSSETDAWRSEWEYGSRLSKTTAGRGGRKGPSPRRLLRKLSAAEEMRRAGEDSEEGEEEEEEQQRPAPQLRYGSVRSRQALPRPSSRDDQRQAVPAPPLQDDNGVNTDDLNRFVSSTTVPTTSTISTSFVKHAGPRPRKGPMQVIRPNDVSGLVGQQVGKMRYDATLMRWVRERGGSGGLERVSEGSAEESRRVGSEESVDVFAGMSEEGSRRGSTGVAPVQQQAEEKSGTDTDSDGAIDVANQTTIDAAALMDTSESEDERQDDRQPLAVPVADGLTISPTSLPIILPAPTPSRPVVGHTNSAPAILTPLPSSAAPRPIRSALRNPNSNGQLSDGTPGLKKKASWLEDIALTPFAEGSRSITRSVSFSDGKKHGQIEGLETGGILPKNNVRAGGVSLSEQLRGLGEEVRAAKDKTGRKASGVTVDDVSGAVPVLEEEMSGKEGGDGNLFDKNGMSLLASARTRRIQDVLGDLEGLSLDNITPSKPSRWPEPVRPPALAPTPGPFPSRIANPSHTSKPAQLQASTTDSESTNGDISKLPARSFRRSRSHRDNGAVGQATFLTECSFAVTSDLLVKVITDVQPFEPYWETLKEVDLNGKGLEGVGRLKEFLPALDEVILNDNAISYLTGLPSSVRTLRAAGNRISSLTSVDHLHNLQVLDLSRNQLDSVSQLRGLKHLRELRVDHNRISDLSSIMSMDSLVKLSARDNRIDKLDLTHSKWGKMESLELPECGLGDLVGLEYLTNLATLNLDDNDLTCISSTTPLLRLRTLRICRNDLALLDLSHFPKVRTVYADENRLAGIQRSDRSKSRLEALSLRSQRTRGLKLSKGKFECLKRLYISGNDISLDFFNVGVVANLAYLEMAACRLSAWPKFNLPALEVLNVNYNFLEDLRGLRGMRGLRKVSVVGNRLGDVGTGDLRGLEQLEEVDLRMNPSTLGYYLSLFIPAHTAPSATRPSLVRPNKTAILLGRTGPNATLSASTRASSTSMFFQQQEIGADWSDMDNQFRRNLPDMWYGKRLIYRGGIMEGCPRLKLLDGLEVGDAERRKAGELLERSNKRDRR